MRQPHDGTITDADLNALHELARQVGWNELMLRMIEREPMLGAMIGMRWSRICKVLLSADVSEQHTRQLLRQIVILLVETAGLQQQAQRRMLDGLLPDFDGEAHE